MNLLIFFCLGAFGLFIQILFYKFIKSKWPALARVLLLFWLLGGAIQLYQLWRLYGNRASGPGPVR